MVGHALERLTLEAGGIPFIENVGNLVCPADFEPCLGRCDAVNER
jgi:hydrogenase nickel incorporation protein HypB